MTKQHYLNNHNSKYVLILGFGASFGVFAILLTIGLSHLKASQSLIASLLNKHHMKLSLVSTMHNMARERSLALYTMAALDDAFERDDEYMKFLDYGGEFARARAQLMQMELTAEEKLILRQQATLTNSTVPLQRKIVQLLHDLQVEEARTLLRNEAIPAQNKVLHSLSTLKDIQFRSAELTIQTTGQSQDSAMRLIITLGIISLISGGLISVYVTRRITDAETSLYIEKERAEITLHSIGDAVITTNERNLIRYINPVAEQLTGWTAADALDKPLGDILPLTHTAQNYALGETNQAPDATESSATALQTLVRKDGAECTIEHTTAPIRDYFNKIIGSIVVFRDVTKMHNLTNQLNYEATHDYLTGLLNRREFEQRLTQTLASTLNQTDMHALLYIDLDQFKVINDTCGHLAGDELLKQLSYKMNTMVRKSDQLARLGGDEFGIILDHCSTQKARNIAEGILAMIQEMKFAWDGKSFDVTASIGVVPITSEFASISEIQSIADSACFEAKDLGRNRVHQYTPDDKGLVKRRGEMHWVHRINKALSEDKFVLYYQDIVPLNSAQQNKQHCEILVRLKNDEGGITPPMAFIPAAERYNIMTLIDQHIIHKTFQFLQSNLHLLSDFSVAINISGQSLCEQEFIECILEEFAKTRIDPTRVTFEITETAAIANLARAVNFIDSFKQLGCSFALDDFGSGLSSFGYLKNIPVDYLKIDGSFVRDIADDPTNYAFVKSIHQIGSVMGLKTIAEYVEDERILDKLLEIGIDYAQGYHFCKPQPLTTLVENGRKKTIKPTLATTA